MTINRILKFIVSLQKKGHSKTASSILTEVREDNKEEEEASIEVEASSVDGQPSGGSGRSEPTPQYGTSGNEFYAGGPSVTPWPTRNKKLLELLKKHESKKNTK